MSLLDFIEDNGPGWTRIGNLYEVTRKPRGLDISSFETIPFIPMEAMPQGGAYSPSSVPKAPGTMTSGTYFERGDLLVAKITPSFENGKQALTFDLPAPFGYATTEVIPLHPSKSGQDRRLLFFYLCIQTFGTTWPSEWRALPDGNVCRKTCWLDLPFPDIHPEEQSAIADALEQIQRVSMADLRCEKKARELKRAAMRALFTRGLRGEAQEETEFGPVPESWKATPLDDCASVQTGVAKGRKFQDVEIIDVPYLRVANVQDGRLDLAEMKEIRIRRSEIERYRLRFGDVVLTEGGDFDKLGRGFIWRGEIDLCVHQNHVFAVRPDRERLLPEFFAYLAQSAYGKAYFLKVAHKTTNLACINSAKLKAFPVPIPPTLEEQHEIVAILDAIDRKIVQHRRKRAVLDELFKALLHKLMTGEIRVADLDLSALDAPKARHAHTESLAHSAETAA